MKLPAITQRSLFWKIAFAAWFVTLWILSSRPAMGPKLDGDFPLDKILHFGYFFGGGGLLSATLFLKKKPPLPWSTIHFLVVSLLFFVGSIDEWHQSWYPFRSGNDAADLTADFVGALVGTFIFRLLQPRVFPGCN